MPPLEGFIGGTYQNLSLPADAQMTGNLYPEILESGTGKSKAVLQAVPGKATWATLTDQPVRGIFAQDQRGFAVGGFTFFELQANGTAIERGAVAADDNPATVASNGQGANQLLITSGGSVYLYNLSTNTLTLDSTFPATHALMCWYMDGYFLVLANNTVYASSLLDGATWNALSVGQRSIASDNLVTILVDDHRILWFGGSKTSEPWTDVGASPFPWAPVAGAFMGVGFAAAFGAARFDNSVIWLGQTEAGGRVAYMLAGGYVAQRVSNHGIEAIWNAYSRVDDLIVWTYSENGHAFAVFYFPTANATWCYDGSTQQWHQRFSHNTTSGIDDADRGRCHCYLFDQHLVGARDSGIIYRQAMTLYADGDRPKRWVRRSPHVGGSENQWIFGTSFELLMETGVGLTTGQGSDPQVMLRWSNDGARTWQGERTTTLGAQGAYQTRVIFQQLGRFRDRVWEVSGSEPVKTTLIDAIFTGRAGRG
jgi:hypothetical protein